MMSRPQSAAGLDPGLGPRPGNSPGLGLGLTHGPTTSVYMQIYEPKGAPPTGNNPK